MPSSLFKTIKTRSVLLMACLVFAGPVLGAGTKVIYPAYETINDTRYDDLIQILDTALKKTESEFGPYELTPSQRPMNEARWLHELKNKSSLINVGWSSTSVEKESEMLPIRIPLRKGILGYRIALIAKDKQALIDNVKTIDDLKKLKIGQGLGWGDVNLYRLNGFTVQETSYEKLFRITALGSIDLFPRGINEIFSENERFSKIYPQLTIEKDLLLYYPWPYYFFFNKDDAKLQQRIETGLLIDPA